MHEEFQKKLVFKVIVSNEKQYSLWLLDREEPPGWRDTGKMRGSATECLAYIREFYFRERQPDATSASSSVIEVNPPVTAAYV